MRSMRLHVAFLLAVLIGCTLISPLPVSAQEMRRDIVPGLPQSLDPGAIMAQQERAFQALLNNPTADGFILTAQRRTLAPPTKVAIHIDERLMMEEPQTRGQILFFK